MVGPAYIIQSPLIELVMHKDRKQLSAKIVIIGNVGVGKSSITIRYVYDKFDLKQQSTLGAAYMQKVCPFPCDTPKSQQSQQHVVQLTQTLKLQIWDTAGQQKYKAIAKLYYRDCRVAILVYDVTRRDTFTDLGRWYEELSKHAPKNTVLIVVANKIDLLDTLINEQPVPFVEGQAYASLIKAKYFEVSAKNKKGVAELFETIAKTIGPMVAREKEDQSKHKLSNSFIQTDAKKRKCCGQ